MDFLKHHIEKVVFGILVLVLGISLFVSVNLGDPSGFAHTGASAPPRATEELDLSRIDRMLASITEEPAQIDVSLNTFTSSIRRECMNQDDKSLIPLDAEICPYCGEKQEPGDPVGPNGIPIRLKRIWGLNPDDPNEVHRVLDGSGFSVLHQWKRGHDPMDPNDIPPLVDYLRILDMEEKSVSFELRGIAEITQGVFMLQLRWRYPGETRWDESYVRVGNRFGRQDEFLAAAFTERRVQENGRTVDQSFAEIRSGRNVLRLSRDGDGARGAISERSARLGLYIGPTWSETVHRDTAFKLMNNSYMVVDIQPDAVVIRAAEAEETITIRKATPEELESAKPPVPERGVPGVDDFVDPSFPFDPSLLSF